MKLSDLKHNHSLTDLLKVLIFSILMLVPFLSVATRCLYVICNKNAYQSYTGNVTENRYVESTYNLPYNEVYFSFNSELNLTSWGSTRIDFTIESIEYINGNLPTNYKNLLLDITTFRLWQDNGNYITWTGLNTNLNGTAYNFTIKCNVIGQSNNLASSTNLFYRIVDTNGLDNVFEYAIDKIAESQYYNWTQNTAIYTGIETMTTQLGITGETIPILLTYWFMLTIIYVVIDIILKLFTALTHMIGNKTAK